MQKIKKRKREGLKAEEKKNRAGAAERRALSVSRVDVVAKRRRQV